MALHGGDGEQPACPALHASRFVLFAQSERVLLPRQRVGRKRRPWQPIVRGRLHLGSEQEASETLYLLIALGFFAIGIFLTSAILFRLHASALGLRLLDLIVIAISCFAFPSLLQIKAAVVLVISHRNEPTSIHVLDAASARTKHSAAADPESRIRWCPEPLNVTVRQLVTRI